MDRASFIKRLIYQSNHRGCKELDFMLGKFANLENFIKMTDEQLLLYADFLNENDWDLYGMMTQKIDSTRYKNIIDLINSN